jgi:hypothetical protein
LKNGRSILMRGDSNGVITVISARAPDHRTIPSAVNEIGIATDIATEMDPVFDFYQQKHQLCYVTEIVLDYFIDSTVI